MDNDSVIRDSYKVFEPKLAFDFISKFIDAAPESALAYTVDYSLWPNHKIPLPRHDSQNYDKFSKYLTRTTGHLYIKMLETIDKLGDGSYHEIYEHVLKPRGTPFGNDVLLFKSLSENCLVELDHLGKYKRKFFKLTSLGKRVLETAKKNDVAYKVLRHFMKFKDTLDEQTMISIQINPETFNDMTPKSYVAMLDAILSQSSVLHEVGSYAYWCNKLIECLKKSDAFFEEFNCPEVNAWLESHANELNVKKFNDVFQKIIKKHAKKAVAA